MFVCNADVHGYLRIQLDIKANKSRCFGSLIEIVVRETYIRQKSIQGSASSMIFPALMRACVENREKVLVYHKFVDVIMIYTKINIS